MSETMDTILTRLNADLKKYRDQIETANTILVIDDEEVVRILFEEMLRKDGYTVLSARSGEEALREMEGAAVNLLVVDKNLPGINGLETIREARKSHEDLEALIITGYSSLDSALEAMEIGAYDYLLKPFDSLEIVRGKIKRALRKQNMALINKRVVGELKSITEGLMKEVVSGEEKGAMVRRFQEEIRAFKEGVTGTSAILIVGGEGNGRASIANFLQEKGHVVRCARDGRDAIGMLDDGPTNLLLVDRDLDDPSWLEFIRSARSHNPDLYSILLADTASMEDILLSMNVGACDYIHNPLNRIDLLDIKVKKSIGEQVSALKYKKLILELKNLSRELIHAKDAVNFFEEISESEMNIIDQLEVGLAVDYHEVRADDGGPSRVDVEIPAPTGLPSAEAGTERARILVIDDEEVVRDVLKELLTNEGYDVSVAETGEEGLAILKAGGPNLILVDKNLPGISGLDVIKSSRDIDPDIEAVLVTGYASIESAILSMELGVCSYIVKPFGDIGQVRQVVRESLKRQAERRHLRARFEAFRMENEEMWRKYEELKKKARELGIAYEEVET